ncbi:MAG: 6,7-dimethyl-8-ribityllumazine synthase [Candidatus Uhrbacteria bacterium]
MDSNTFDKISGAGYRFAIVRAHFNDEITQGLLEGAHSTLVEVGVSENDIEIVEVPGSFEICYMADQLARQEKFDAIICLGAIIKGDTKHDEHLAHAVYDAMNSIARTYQVPVIAGVLTCHDQDQATKRSSGEMNRGVEAAKTAIEMADLARRMSQVARRAND